MKYFTTLKISLVFFIFFNCFPAFSGSLEPVEFQLTLIINWANNPDNGAVELGTYNSSDTWTMRVKFFDVPIAEQGSHNPASPAVIYTSEMENESFSVMISSTTSPDENHPATYHDALLSYDIFSFKSEAGGEGFSFRDRENGLYEPEAGSALHTWVLDRYVSSPQVSAGTITRTSQGFLDFLSGYDGLKVEEIFINNIHQISYGKTGVATVADIQVVSPNNNPFPAECHYEVTQEWNEGFTANVRIKNLGSQAIENWQMNIEFDDLIRVDNFWNTSLTGIPPFFTAKDETWNGRISANKEVTFGLVASKAADQSSSAKIKSIICR